MKMLNKHGDPITFNAMENKRIKYLNSVQNALGYEIDITSLTTVMKKISEQKFFEIAPADYVPIRVGEGAWSTNLTTYRSFSLADDFSTGLLGGRTENARLALADAGVDSLTIKVKNWAKSIAWTLFDLQQASKANNWDLVSEKEAARKKNWDLGIQKIAFLGMDTEVQGLLNQTGVTANTTAVTKSLKSMTAQELETFVGVVLDLYRTNCNRSAWPTHFVIPESDYLGLSTHSNPAYPLSTRFEVLMKTFGTLTNNSGFKILPCSYGDAAYNEIGSTRYALYNYDEASVRMDIPVDYTNTVANSIENFSFQNVGYGQFTGVKAYRPLEMIYFQR